ncbi:MAG: hypothetical protein BJ554DRAFT_6880, partial [Olpidium bornovanus]
TPHNPSDHNDRPSRRFCRKASGKFFLPRASTSSPQLRHATVTLHNPHEPSAQTALQPWHPPGGVTRRQIRAPKVLRYILSALGREKLPGNAAMAFTSHQEQVPK